MASLARRSTVSAPSRLGTARERSDVLRVGLSMVSQGAGQFTGTATYVRELVREFGAREAQIELDVLCNPQASELLGHAASANIRLNSGRYRRGGGTGAGRAAELMRQLMLPTFTPPFPPDVQLVHYPLTFAIPRVAVPTVVSLHDVQHRDLPQHFSRVQQLWRRRVFEDGARRAAIVITLSQHSRQRIVELLGLDPDRVVAIPMAVDQERFRPDVDVNDARAATGLGLPRRFVFYPASYWPHKNHLALLDAIAGLADDELHLVLTGALFGKRDMLMTQVTNRGLAGRVHHLGFVSDASLPALYRRACALVFPSSYEGFGVPPLEAMACGTPVASSLATSLREVCGHAALELNPRDSRQMAEAIAAIVSDEPLRERLRRAGMAQARRFSWSASADAHLLAYRRAIELA